ncbi:MAG: DUF4416 family protein [Candidatus Eremiobacterota bacterium]
MGKIRPPKKVKLFCGMISSDESLFNTVIEELSVKFGPVDCKSSVMPFTQTDYYKEEMGENLKKFFVSFTLLIDSIFLVDVKIFTQEIEEKYSLNGKRRINLDPGYLSEAKMVLATTKDHQHRIYMGKGIYGEVTLKFKNKTYEPWEWTYNDYKKEEYIEYFIELRNILRKQLGRKQRDIGVSVP